MEIQVNVAKTIQTIQKERKQYIIDYNKNVKLYHKKLKEYADYVLGLSKSKHVENVKSPPSIPSDQVEEFDKSIEILKAHTHKLLIMQDHEYQDLMSVTKTQKSFNDRTTATLSSLSY